MRIMGTVVGRCRVISWFKAVVSSPVRSVELMRVVVRVHLAV
jgi:hypothetical protein